MNVTTRSPQYKQLGLDTIKSDLIKYEVNTKREVLREYNLPPSQNVTPAINVFVLN